MSPRHAIIDTSVLLFLYYLDLLPFLNLIYVNVRVPKEVENEFLYKSKSESEKSTRFDFLIAFYEKHKSWFTRCNEYGSDLVDIYLTDKRLDRGEAEVFAQNQFLGSIHELLLDQNKGRKIAHSEYAKYHGVLYILANFDLRFRCCKYYESIQALRQLNVGRFSAAIIDEVYKMGYEKLYK